MTDNRSEPAVHILAFPLVPVGSVMTMPEMSEASEARAAEVVTQVPVPSPGSSVRVPFGGATVAVFNSAGRLFALEAECGHRKGPLDRGVVSDGAVACPWHGVRFDLKSGEVVGGNFFVRRLTKSVRAFRVRAVDGRIALMESIDTATRAPTPPGSPAVAALGEPS